jgi:hypothetical protein
LLDAFGASERVVRYTWQIASGQRLFSDETWRNYFELSSTLAMAIGKGERSILQFRQTASSSESLEQICSTRPIRTRPFPSVSGRKTW